jgi:hypothetical protein
MDVRDGTDDITDAPPELDQRCKGARSYLEELIAHEPPGPAAAAHGAAGVRAVAAYGAPQLPLDTARPLLEALLDDPHPAVVKRAVVAPGELEAGEVLSRIGASPRPIRTPASVAGSAARRLIYPFTQSLQELCTAGTMGGKLPIG